MKKLVASLALTMLAIGLHAADNKAAAQPATASAKTTPASACAATAAACTTQAKASCAAMAAKDSCCAAQKVVIRSPKAAEQVAAR